MALTISNNGAVQTASYYLDKNQRALQSSIKKLASGKKLIDASADPGTLSVAMKVRLQSTAYQVHKIMCKTGWVFLRFRTVCWKQLVRL